MGLCIRRRQQHHLQEDDLEQQQACVQPQQPPEPLSAVVVVPADSAAPTHLLDLPPDLLAEVLHQAPRSLRNTCHAFRLHLDAGRSTLKLCWPPYASPTTRCPSTASIKHLLRRSVHLRSLKCSHAPMPCTSFATLCPTLTALDISRCHWQTDLSRLTSFAHLTSLSLDGCNHLLDLDHLSGLSTTCCLSTLVLSNCTNLFDVSPLAGFSALTHLDLSNTLWFSDVRPLGACTSLTSLSLSTTGGGAVADLSRLTLLPALSTLVLMCQQNANTEPLRLLTQLTSLTLSHPQLRDITPLALPALVTLDLRLVRATNLSPLTQCRSLSTLCLVGCSALWGLHPLIRCRAVTQLDVSACARVADLSPLADCLSLRQLCVTECGAITALGPLARCPALKMITLSRCSGLTTLRAIADSRSLTSLRLRRCCNVRAKDVADLLIRLELLEKHPLLWQHAKGTTMVVEVDGKPAAAPLRVRATEVLFLAAVDLPVVTCLAWLLGVHTCARVLGLLSAAAVTLFAVFVAHGHAATEYGD